MLTAGSAWGATVIPPPTLFPLNQIAVPQPPNLFQFVKSRPAAIMLGKALFWDMQAGSDGLQACASCHFSAGADNRVKNTINPGFDNIFHVRGPNQTLQPTDFPFLERQDPDAQSTILRDSDDIVGSQGIRLANFVNIVVGSAVDNGVSVSDPVFNFNGVNTRRVTGRQAPSVINAIFNLNNFWDGRAHFEFNGVNPFGPLDPTAGVWFNINGVLVKQAVAIQFASLASQATGPPLNETEMSYRGRTFPDLGRKMLSLTPLARQLVHPEDSELGLYSRATLQPDGSVTGSKGLNIGYAQLIREAFQDKFWNSNLLTPGGYSQMEANFSLFWGLAIQLYEATLVSDQTPFDQFLGGDQNALTDQQKDGFNTFFGAGGCGACHFGSELTSASVRNSGFLTNASHALIEPMAVASGQQIIYDNGFNNTAVRPTVEDICRGANTTIINSLTGQPFPLSFSALAELQALGKLGFNSSPFPVGSPLTPILPAGIPATFPVANNGNFKVPSLRNVELTPPYFHNGGVMSLQDVVEFYTRGGDFRQQNQDSLDNLIADIAFLQHNPARQAALVAFMNSMTDGRVRSESAPFDHPELFIPNGDPEVLIRLPAKGLDGVAAQPLPTVTLNPVTSPTIQTSQLLSGSMESGATIRVKVNNGPSLPVDTVADTTWSTLVTDLAAGSNTITVTATDMAGGVTTLTATIVSSAVQFSGSLVVNGGAAITRSPSVSLALNATGSNPITHMQFSKDGAYFFPLETYSASRTATLLPGDGLKTIYVRFRDSSGNISPIYADSITLDTTPPTGTMSINGGTAFTASTAVTLALTAFDANTVTQMQFSKDGVNYFAFEPFTASRGVTLPPGDGPKIISVRFKDGAGNVSAPISASITLDTTLPTGTIAFTTTDPTASATGTLALTASDANSVTQMQFSKNGSPFFALEPFAASRTVSLAPGPNTLTVRFRDTAGNLSAPVSATITRN
jgi:cytochrome c peroxidase